MSQRQLTFADGVAAEISAAALVPLLYFLSRGASFAAMYRDFGDVALPLTTRIVLHPLWRIAVPALLVVLGGWVLARRPHRHAMPAVAVLAVLAAALTYVAAYRPIWMLAGNIAAE